MLSGSARADPNTVRFFTYNIGVSGFQPASTSAIARLRAAGYTGPLENQSSGPRGGGNWTRLPGRRNI